MARTAVRATISIPWKNLPLLIPYIPPMENFQLRAIETSPYRVNEWYWYIWGLARHSVECTGNIDWEGAKRVGRETGLRQRKVREELSRYVNDTME